MEKKAYRLAYIEGWSSIGLNTVIFVFKYWVGIATGSVAILADAWHTLSDSLTSVIVIIGTKASAKPADESHPFGHGRAELIASIIIGVMLLVVGFNFIMEAVQKLRNHETAAFGTTAAIVLAASIVLKEGMAQFSFWAGKKTRSRTLMADGWHHRSDAITSVIILIGIFFNKTYWWIDGVLGIAVALLICYAAFNILRESVNPLLGEAPDRMLALRIREISTQIIPDRINIHHIHIHRYGYHTELTLHIRLTGSMSLYEAHQIGTSLEGAIRTALDMETTIHFEPEEE